MLLGRQSLSLLLAFVWITGNSKPVSFLDRFSGLPQVIENYITDLVFTNKCLPGLGCFYNGPPFYHPLYRPLSLAPFDLELMDTKFCLFTPSTLSDNKLGTLIAAQDSDSIDRSGFEKDLPIKFIVHGYIVHMQSNLLFDSIYAMKDAFLNEGPYNIILVDWGCCNRGIYPQAVANSRVVGAQLAELIKFLQNYYGINPQTVHLIGHSLGVHVCGFAAKRVPNLGRITGLDPAGPYFHKATKEIRLDASDANLVDIYHTNTGNNIMEGSGLNENIGDLDFYPNGGVYQPGCGLMLWNPFFAGIQKSFVATGKGITNLLPAACNHMRSVWLYTATIDSSKCNFMATQCENDEKFQKGECKDRVKVRMGFPAQKDLKIPPGLKYFFETSGKFPFCEEEQKIKLKNMN